MIRWSGLDAHSSEKHEFSKALIDINFKFADLYSPLGLLDIARSCVIHSADNPSPKYNFQKNDEVWIVIDVDIDKTISRKPQIEKVLEFCKSNEGWNLVQSNPCFEVWLHYHLFKEQQIFVGDDKCTNWKNFVNDSFSGGFDSRKHPIFIQRATVNAKNNFKQHNNELQKGSTEFKSGHVMGNKKKSLTL